MLRLIRTLSLGSFRHGIWRLDYRKEGHCGGLLSWQFCRPSGRKWTQNALRTINLFWSLLWIGSSLPLLRGCLSFLSLGISLLTLLWRIGGSWPSLMWELLSKGPFRCFFLFIAFFLLLSHSVSLSLVLCSLSFLIVNIQRERERGQYTAVRHKLVCCTFISISIFIEAKLILKNDNFFYSQLLI